MKSWCTQVITNRGAKSRDIQLQWAPDSCFFLLPYFRASWEVGFGSIAVKIVEVQLAKDPITFSWKCKFDHVIFQPLTSLQWLLIAIRQKTKILPRSYRVLHNMDDACLCHESPPHFLRGSVAHIISPLALGFCICISFTWNNLSPPSLPSLPFINIPHLLGRSSGITAFLDILHQVSFPYCFL